MTLMRGRHHVVGVDRICQDVCRHYQSVDRSDQVERDHRPYKAADQSPLRKRQHHVGTGNQSARQSIGKNLRVCSEIDQFLVVHRGLPASVPDRGICDHFATPVARYKRHALSTAQGSTAPSCEYRDSLRCTPLTILKPSSRGCCTSCQPEALAASSAHSPAREKPSLHVHNFHSKHPSHQRSECNRRARNQYEVN